MAKLIPEQHLVHHGNHWSAAAIRDGLKRSNPRVDRVPSLQELPDPEENYQKFQIQWFQKPGIPNPSILMHVKQIAGEDTVSTVLKRTHDFVQTLELKTVPCTNPANIYLPNHIVEKCWAHILPTGYSSTGDSEARKYTHSSY